MVDQNPWPTIFYPVIEILRAFQFFLSHEMHIFPHHELHPRKANGWVSQKLGGVIDVPFGGILNREPFVTFGFQLFSLAGVG